MKKQRSIQARMFMCFAFILLVALSNSVYSLFTVRYMRSQLAREVQGNAALLDNARQVTISIANMRSSMRGITLFSMTHNAAPLAAAQKAFEKSNEEARAAIDAMQKEDLTSEDRALADGIRSRLGQWRENFQQFAELCMSGHADQASELTLKQTSPLMDWLQKAAADLGRESRERQEQGNLALVSGMARTSLLNGVLLVVLLASAVAAWRVVSRIVVVLKEIGDSFQSGAQEVLNAASEIAAYSQSLAGQASEQASSLEETSASSEEISSMARRNSENSETTATIAGHSGERFMALQSNLDEMVSGMEEIRASSGKISKIIKVIDEIAFQTNILALNAAVEAARAGEAGTGFAVVANEVRNLAHRSAKAAQDTTSLIEESIARSNHGKQKVDQVAEAVRSIGAEAAKAKELADEVKIGSREQLRGIEQIASAIVQMQHTTQQTAASAEEGAAASEQLKAHSEALNGLALRMGEMLAVR